MARLHGSTVSQKSLYYISISDLSKKPKLLILTYRFNYCQTETFNLEKSWSKIAAEIAISIEQFLFLNFRRNDKNSKHREDVTDVKTHVIDAYASYYVCVDIIGACNFSNTVFYILFISFFLVKFEMNKS